MAARARRLRRVLAGEDGPDRGALPIGELLDVRTLAAVVVLAVNDHVLKGALPGWLTGKLSDVAGLVFAPLLATALLGLALAAARRLGAAVDPSLSRARLLAAIAIVGAGFALVEMWPPATAAYLAALDALHVPSTATRDPTDLLALPALLGAYAIGRAEIARLPLGRLAVLLADPSPSRLADVRRYADPAAVDQLLAAVTSRDAAAIDAALDRLRG